jgi:primosomal protein N' (replication factor Y) (superfamily II helicase)
MKECYVDVLLPLPVDVPFTYRVPEKWVPGVEAGKRVIIPFGQKKYYSAVITAVHARKPEKIAVKEIQSLLDDAPVVYPQNLKLWKWMADYYCCTQGEVMKAALPAGLKLESSAKLKAREGIDTDNVSREEKEILSILGNRPQTLREIQKKKPETATFLIIQSLLEKKCLTIEEKINPKYKAKTEAFVTLNKTLHSEPVLRAKARTLQKAKKQEELFMQYCHLAKVFSSEERKEISRKELMRSSSFSPAVLKGLIDKGILVVTHKEVSRLVNPPVEQGELNMLNPFQEKALRAIEASFQKKNTVLLHGVTSSGKTEIYMHLIEKAIRQGKQVLYLVPEIALTAQLIGRLRRIFGIRVGVYHSRLNDPERMEIWENVRNWKRQTKDSFQVILGARSAVFLPFQELGLVVVDEEHEHSFKQVDPAPRYNARDIAVVAGIQFKAPVLLGTATPSFESYQNAQSGKYGLVELEQRHGDMELPEIVVSDIRRAYKRRQMRSFLGPEMYEKIAESLGNKEQVILFQNRRGYAPFVECMACGWIPKCERCDVSLTYHRATEHLVCHYCGFRRPVPERCPECGSREIKTRGMGTEKIEDEIKKLFPQARVERMDLDSTRKRNALDKLIHNLETRKTDILVGTQMVTKGLDFEHVNVVGIINADNLLTFPDFRAHERSYQLMSQVSGRAGRKHRKGTVIIQTTQPEHPVLNEIRNQAFKETFTRQLKERKMFQYPPFYRLVKVVVKHRDPEKLTLISNQLAEIIRRNRSFIVMGPEYPFIGRVSRWYQKEIWVKIKRGPQLAENKQFIYQRVQKVKRLRGNSGAVFNIDVDPM